jgi:hypothetical protein
MFCGIEIDRSYCGNKNNTGGRNVRIKKENRNFEIKVQKGT